MELQQEKICAVCGKEYTAKAISKTCSNYCRAALSILNNVEKRRALVMARQIVDKNQLKAF